MTVKLVPEGEFSVGTKLEKKPPARGWQGLAKEDWTTEWFCECISLVCRVSIWLLTFGKKLNSMAVPTLAVMLLGLYRRLPPSPTATPIVVPIWELTAMAAMAARPKSVWESFIMVFWVPMTDIEWIKSCLILDLWCGKTQNPYGGVHIREARLRKGGSSLPVAIWSSPTPISFNAEACLGLVVLHVHLCMYMQPLTSILCHRWLRMLQTIFLPCWHLNRAEYVSRDAI